MLGEAIWCATEAHKGQYDKAGKPYILHPLRLMQRLAHKSEEIQAIAVLHDVLEDNPNWSYKRLYTNGVTSKVVFDALSILTHSKELSYEEYIEGVATNYEAIVVKMEDLKDNSDITRLKGVTERDLERTAKYHKAYTFLKEQRKLWSNT